MGSGQRQVEWFLGNMGYIQGETRPSMQREDQLTMETGLERIAAKARCEPDLRFSSLAHHITRERVCRNFEEDFRSLGSRGGWTDGGSGEEEL